MLLCWAGQAVCCAGQACCNCLWMACSEWGAHKKVFSKLGYIAISFFSIFLSFLFLFFAKDMKDQVSFFISINCPDGTEAWFGISAVYRMSFALVVFHTLMLIILLICKGLESEIGPILNDGCWTFNIMIIFTVFVASFWIDNKYIMYYGYFWRLASALFLIFQGIWILSIAYKLNRSLVDYHSSTGSGYSMAILLAVTALFYIFDAIFFYHQIKWFGSCQFNIWVFVVLIIMFVIFTIMTVLQTREDASILTNSIVVSYLLYLSWSAFASEKNESCNPFLKSDSNTLAQIVLGFVFTSISLLSISIVTKNNTSNENGFESNWAESEDSEEIKDIEIGNQKINVEDSYIFPTSYATMFFHGIMILAWAYYAMLISNWGDPTINHSRTHFFSANDFSVGMKLFSQLVCYLIFSFSLIGPLIWPDRDWDD